MYLRRLLVCFIGNYTRVICLRVILTEYPRIPTGRRSDCVVDREQQKRETGPMSKPSDRHVVPNPEGGWDVVRPNADRASSHHDTQADAIGRAREIVGNSGGGEIVIHGRDGRVRDSDTVAPGNDPHPPRDRR